MTSPVSGKNSSVLPRNDSGNPDTRTSSDVARGVTSLSPCSILGWAARLASKAWLLTAVLLFRGTLRVNSPSSGMQTL